MTAAVDVEVRRARSRERSARYRDRQRAAGLRLVHGRFTSAPISRPSRPHREPPAHGTYARYVSVSWRCRCDECRAANADYQRARRRLRLDRDTA